MVAVTYLRTSLCIGKTIEEPDLLILIGIVCVVGPVVVVMRTLVLRLRVESIVTSLCSSSSSCTSCSSTGRCVGRCLVQPHRVSV